MSVETTALALLNAKTQESLTLTKDRILIGRSSSCDYVIEDASISEYHALLIIDQHGSATVMDLSSHNGTYVNGLRIASELRAKVAIFLIHDNNLSPPGHHLKREFEILDTHQAIHLSCTQVNLVHHQLLRNYMTYNYFNSIKILSNFFKF